MVTQGKGMNILPVNQQHIARAKTTSSFFLYHGDYRKVGLLKMKKRIISIFAALCIICMLLPTNAYAAKNYSSSLNALSNPYKGYTSIDDLETKRIQGETLTSLNFSGQECVNYATTRLKEKVFGYNVSFGIYTGHGKDVASSFITYGYGDGGKNCNKVFTAKDGQQYTVTAYVNDNGAHISPNSLVCFDKNSNMTNSRYGHVVFVEEIPIIDGVKYVYYTEGGTNLRNWPVKRQTFDAFYNQGVGYTGAVAITSISNGSAAAEIISGAKMSPWNYSKTPVRTIRYKSPVMTGEDVKWLQQALNIVVNANLTVDGSAGPATQTAIKLFQRQYGLAQDGSFGPASRSKMVEVLNGLKYFENPWNYSATPTRTIRYTTPTMKGNDIKWLQQALNIAVNANLTVDGSAGPATQAAVKSFQRQYGLTQDGSFGPASRGKIVEVLNSKGYFAPN